MGGTVIILATLTGYLVAHLVFLRGVTASGLLVLGLMTGLGAVGFLDDFIKIRKQRSLGLTTTAKFVGQAIVAVAFGILATRFANERDLTPVSTHLSFVRDYGLDFGAIAFIVWAYLMVAATSNGVNLTDGLDGLATGASTMVFGAYVVIAFWKFGNSCASVTSANCYDVRDPLDIAIIAAAAMGACFGFLWWNASPARIFMGDTGSLALGGALAGIAMTTRTELLLIVLGGLFVVETISVILQVAFFRGFRRRLFNMAPVHHHFELAGWNENTVIVRFWIIAGLAVAFGLGVFYAEFLSQGTAR
jgi:phospho-N-acetylmuramoyl-pentapeptide-transferase